MFDPVLLQSLAAVVDEGSFTKAGARLKLQQSTISQHIRKLEQAAGRKLIDRTTHRLKLTFDGEALYRHAIIILEAHERARLHFARSSLSGRVRFGASEDFVMTRLPEVLRHFAMVHPSVQVEVTVALSAPLFGQLEAGQLDLVLGKQRVGERKGILVRRERMVWLGSQSYTPDRTKPLPLILYPSPSIGRTIALEALEGVGRAWQQVCSSTSFSGLYAAALAGFGLTLQAESVIPSGLRVFGIKDGLSELSGVEFVLAGATTKRGPAEKLAAAILAAPWTRSGLDRQAPTGASFPPSQNVMTDSFS